MADAEDLKSKLNHFTVASDGLAIVALKCTPTLCP
jgi:hypothetical protein